MNKLREKEDPDFGKVAFGDPWQDAGYPAFLKMQGKSSKDKEDNTKTEKKILAALEDWANGAANYIANDFTRLLPVIKRGKKLFPNIFRPEGPNGTIVYRGLDNMNRKLESALIKNTTEEDWKPMRGFMVCTKPIKYTPHRDWQSWSYSTKVAKNFGGNAVLLTKQDDNFYFSTKTMSIMYKNQNEQEILHNGKTFSAPVFIAVNAGYFEDMMGGEISARGKGKPSSIDKVGRQLLGKKNK